MFNIFKKKTEEVIDVVAEKVEKEEVKSASTGETERTSEIEQLGKQNQPPPLTYKEMRALKKARYQTDIMNNNKFKTAYVLGNKKTGQMVEVRASSSFHACNIIGWKSNQVIVLAQKTIEEPKEEVIIQEVKA
jgi:hypothetical protein